MKNHFDTIASQYYNYTPKIPTAYINLLLETFHTASSDRVIDLGCGSGEIAQEFAKKSSFVQGLDASKIMIKMAKRHDKNHTVRWIQGPVENFDFHSNKYNLIFCFESFHLFLDHVSLIKKCSAALKVGGFLGIGWRMFEWDMPLKDIIKETFDTYGIDRGEWGLWTCPTFSDDIKSANTDIKKIQTKQIKISNQTTVNKIANYVLHNSRSLLIDKNVKAKIIKELEKRFLSVYPAGHSNGDITYSLIYAEKESK